MTTDLHNQLQAHRPMLLKFALRQLRNTAWAEDAVSETLLAALASDPRHPDSVPGLLGGFFVQFFHRG